MVKPTKDSQNLQNILSVDLEEWYHPEYIRTKEIPNKQDRISETLDETLYLLSLYGIRATFFIVGELVERHPDIVGKIRENGHEIAFHGFHHEPLIRLNADALRSEIKKFSALTRTRCLGFRAPSFSLNDKTKWALKILEDEGYRYDSSIFPSRTPLYGHWTAPMKPYRLSYERVASEDENSKLWEFSLLVYSLVGIRIPTAGGFYLRFFPAKFVSKAIRKANKLGFPAVVFFHNWELDPKMPRMKLGFYKKFVTYHKLSQTKQKLEHLFSEFEFSSIEDYMKNNGL